DGSTNRNGSPRRAPTIPQAHHLAISLASGQKYDLRVPGLRRSCGPDPVGSAARTVGQHTDGEGIITEMRKVCASRPSMTLAGVTFTVYSEMANSEMAPRLPRHAGTRVTRSRTC